MLNNDKNYATITIAKTSSGLKSFRATKNERGTPFSSATRKSLKGEKGMKKLWQMLLVFAMAVSCVCAVACSNKNENKTCKHDYEETVVAATCTTGGYTEHKCSKCGDTYKDNEVAALNHDMTDWAEKTPATCTAAQVLEKHCKRTGCDYEETKDGDAALNHDMEWTITLNPTCTEGGKKDGACKRTGCTYTETDVKIDKLGHHYVESKTDPKAKAATCTEDGLKVEICDNPGCDDDETRKESVIPALGHTDDGTKAVVTDPTCTEQGYTTYHCETCDQDYRDDYVNELGHEMALEQTVKVSCLTDGYELWICQRDNCEYSEKREIADKLDHVFDTDGNCKSGCGKTINDKLTWINTKYDVTYNASADRLTLIGGDPCGEGSIAPGSETNYKSITIPAAVLVAKKAAGISTFTVTMYRIEGTTPQFGFCYDESTFEYSANNVPHYTSKVITIDDEMLQNGFKFIASYTDLTQRNSAWGGTKICDGFDFDIEFIKPFDINDKSMWLTGGFASMTYSADKGLWVITDADPGKEQVVKTITIKADVFKALAETNGSFKIKLYAQADDQLYVFGFQNATYGNGGTVYPTAVKFFSTDEIVITADMSDNGYTFVITYADQNQRNDINTTATHVTGFNMDIEFVKPFNLEDKGTWFAHSFDHSNFVDGDKWNIIGKSCTAKLTLRAEVISAMMAEGKNKITFTLGRLEENQDTKFAVEGYGTKNGSWSNAFTLTDDMKTKGLTLEITYSSCGWANWVAPTGFTITAIFEGIITLNAENKTYTYDGVVGYDGTIAEFNVSSITDNGTGGTYFMVGSYGVYYRGGQYRLASLTGGAYSEVSGAERKGATVSLNKGGKVGVSVTVKDDNTVTVSVYENGTLLTSWDVSRVSDEVTSAEASATVSIVTSYVTECVLSK